MKNIRLGTDRAYALLERYAAGEYVSDIGRNLGLSTKEVVGVLRASVARPAFETAAKRRSERIGGQDNKLQRKGGQPPKWTRDNPVAVLMAKEYVVASTTLNALAQVYGMKHGSNVQMVLERAFGREQYEQMREARSVRIRNARMAATAIGKTMPRKGTARPAKWNLDDGLVIRLSKAYVSGEEKVGDIARHFNLRAHTEVARILRTAYGERAFNKLRKQRSINRSLLLRDIDLEMLVKEYAAASVSIKALANQHGLSSPESLNDILKRALGDSGLRRLREKRAQKPHPYPCQPRKWTQSNPIVRRITQDYMAGKKTLRQMSSEMGVYSGHIVYILKSAFGAHFEKMRVERMAVQKKLRREEEK